MKIIITIGTLLVLFASITSCGGEATVVETNTTDSTAIALTLCDCLSDTTMSEECKNQFPEPLTKEDKLLRISEAKECGVELSFEFDTLPPLDSLPEPESIDEVLEMEVPDPISEDCQKYLEELSAAIESYARVVEKVSANPDDFELIIKKTEKEDNVNEKLNNPMKFECSDNESFRFKMEKLDEQMSKLLE